jgi:pimeloyl-ACP methyl ester carboxylesterase
MTHRNHAPAILLPTAIMGVAALAMQAAANAQSARLARWRYPPRGYIRNVEGAPMHYFDVGAGEESEVVVFLHGAGTMGEELMLSGLPDIVAAQGRRVIVPDRAGYAHSARPGRDWDALDHARQLLTLLTHLGVRRATLVGHSYGTLVALAAALMAPERIQGLVLASGVYMDEARPDLSLYSAYRVPLLGDVLRWTVGPVAHRLSLRVLLLRLFAPDAPPAAFRRNFPMDLLLQPEHIRATAEDLAAIRPSVASLVPKLDAIRCPVTIVGGREDAIVDQNRHAEWLSARLRDSRLFLFPAGHMLHHTCEEARAAILGGVDRAAGTPFAASPADASPRPTQAREQVA